MDTSPSKSTTVADRARAEKRSRDESDAAGVRFRSSNRRHEAFIYGTHILAISMPLAAELMVLVGALAIIAALVIRKIPNAKAAAFVGGSLIIAGTTFGGLAWAGIPAFIALPGDEPPVAESLFTVQILEASDTDRSEVGESLSADGHSITWVMADNDMDGLGDVNLDIRVTNANAGEGTTVWPFVAFVSFVSSSTATPQPIVNQTAFNSRWAVAWTLTEVGSPTLAQSGDSAESRDWTTGLSDVLNADFSMNPDATADLAAGMPGRIELSVGGVALVAHIIEQ